MCSLVCMGVCCVGRREQVESGDGERRAIMFAGYMAIAASAKLVAATIAYPHGIRDSCRVLPVLGDIKKN